MNTRLFLSGMLAGLFSCMVGWGAATPTTIVDLRGNSTVISTSEIIMTGGAWVDIRAHGAVADDSTEDSDDIQQAIDAVTTAGGGTIFFPPGNWTMNTLVTNGSNTRFVFSPGSTITAGFASSSGLFRAIGSQASSVLLSGDAAKAATSVSVTAGAEAGFAVGDWVKIGSTNLWTPNTTAEGSIDQQRGEIAQVASTASGSITLTAPLQDNYTAAHLGFIAKITFVENVSFEGPVRIIGQGFGTSSTGIWLDRCRRVKIDGLRLDDFDNITILARECLDVDVSGVTIHGGTSDQEFYGVTFAGGCQWVSFRDSYVDACRHAFTVGGIPNRSGIARWVTVSNVKAVNQSAASFDTHCMADYVTIANCTSVDSLDTGILMRTPTANIIGNTIVRPGSYGIRMLNQTGEATRYNVADNIIDNSGNDGIRIDDPTTAALAGTIASSNILFINVTGNAIYAAADTAISVVSLESFPLHTVSIANNTISRCAESSGRAIYLDNVVNWSCANNTITGLGATTDGYRIEDSAYGSIVGGLIEWASAPAAEYGIQGINADDVVVSGITVRRATRPALLDNNCSNITFDRINTQSCTSDYTLGSGFGHTINRPPVVQVLTSSGTWTNLAGAKSVHVTLVAGGGGGGSGRRGAAGTVRCGGGGGAGSGWTTAILDASVLGATETVTIGAGGTGGAAITADDTNGSNGGAGNASSFGAFVVTTFPGGGGGGTAAAGTAGSVGLGGVTAATTGAAASGTGGVGVAGTQAAGSGAGSGGSGGGITSGDAASNGGAGGNGARTKTTQATAGTGGTAGGTVAGGNGTDGSTGVAMGGAGGGGGASSTTGAAGAGGNGGIYGAGGGGGGASLNGNDSGAGGNGAPGLAVVITYF